MAPALKRWRFFLLRQRTRRNGFMSPTKSGHLTADLCRAKAKACLYLAEQKACLYLAEQGVSRSKSIVLEHIVETAPE
jgi:hypothetical protein